MRCHGDTVGQRRRRRRRLRVAGTGAGRTASGVGPLGRLPGLDLHRSRHQK